MQALRKAAFLDRDGVINLESSYVSRWEDFKFVPGAVDAMRALQQVGFALVVVTNQSGIARGFYTEDQYQALTVAMKQALAEAGAAVDAVYHCPHHPAGSLTELAIDCYCRKPAPGMIFRASRELNLSLSDSILVGDKSSDIQAARAAGVGNAYIIHSDNSESGHVLAGADAAYVDLISCVSDLLWGSDSIHRT
jgi:D-glycero-D-manno-heptose 1,7-bisphosphate phosphatase